MSCIDSNNDFLPPACKEASKKKEKESKPAVNPLIQGAIVLVFMAIVALIFATGATLIDQWDVIWGWLAYITTFGGSFWGGVVMASIGIFTFIWCLALWNDRSNDIFLAGLIFGALLWFVSFAATALLSFDLESLTVYQQAAIWFIRVPLIILIFGFIITAITVAANK